MSICGLILRAALGIQQSPSNEHRAQQKFRLGHRDSSQRQPITFEGSRYFSVLKQLYMTLDLQSISLDSY